MNTALYHLITCVGVQECYECFLISHMQHAGLLAIETRALVLCASLILFQVS